jgi:hypothetical protein
LVGQDASVDDVGQASLQRPAGLGWGLAFAQLAQVVAAPGSRVAGLADRDEMQGGVELAVPPVLSRWRCWLPLEASRGAVR